MGLGESWASKDSCDRFVSWAKHINSFYTNSIIIRIQGKSSSDSLGRSSHLLMGSSSPMFDWWASKLQWYRPSGRNDTDFWLEMGGVILVLTSNEFKADETYNHKEKGQNSNSDV